MRIQNEWSGVRRSLVENCVPPKGSKTRGCTPVVQKLVLLLLSSMGDISFPSVGTLAELACSDERTVKGTLRSLEEWGAIKTVPKKRSNGSQRSSEYHLNYAAIAAHQGEQVDAEAEPLCPPGGATVAPTKATVAPPMNLLLNLQEEPAHDAKPSRRPPSAGRERKDPDQGELIPTERTPVPESQPAAAPKAMNAYDVKVVWDVQYASKYGVQPKWGGRQAKVASTLLGQIRSTAASRRPPGNVAAMLASVIQGYLADVSDRFVVGKCHAFEFIEDKAPALLAKITNHTPGDPASGRKRGAWNAD